MKDIRKFHKKPLAYRLRKGEEIAVLKWVKWPSYDFIFGVPTRTNKYFGQEAAFFQYRDTRRKKVKCGFYVDKGELRELALGFARLRRASGLDF